MFFSMIFHAYGLAIVLLPLIYHGFVYSFLENKKIPGTVWLFLGGAVLISILGWAWYAAYNFFGFAPNMTAQSICDPFQYIPDPRQNVVGFLKGVGGNLFAGIKILEILLLGLTVAFLKPHKARLAQVFYAFLLIILPLTLILLADVKSQYWFLPRQFVWVIPFFGFWLAWCWDSIFTDLPLTGKKQRL